MIFKHSQLPRGQYVVVNANSLEVNGHWEPETARVMRLDVPRGFKGSNRPNRDSPQPPCGAQETAEVFNITKSQGAGGRGIELRNLRRRGGSSYWVRGFEAAGLPYVGGSNQQTKNRSRMKIWERMEVNLVNSLASCLGSPSTELFDPQRWC